MSITSKLRQGRNNWREKATERANTLRYLRKENMRLKKERDQYKKELKEVKKPLEEKKNALLEEKKETVYIVLQLFVSARISFRGIARVLKVIGPRLGLVKTPCHQTIINWVTRLSITRALYPKQLETQSNQTETLGSNTNIAIIDISTTMGANKILSVLFLNAEHHLYHHKAPQRKDVNYAAVAVADSFPFETVADFLRKIIKTIGKPRAILKDGGTELAKAVRLLEEDQCPCISDVSHVVANLFKHEYQEHPWFETFMSTCGRISKEFKQTIFACLTPPKTSTKARFMNLQSEVKWAEKLLKHSPKGRACHGSVLEKLRFKLGQMPSCRAFITRFLRDAAPLLTCQKLLKTKGLNQDTYKGCQEILQTIPPRAKVRIGFNSFLEKHLERSKKLNLDKTGMLISSDIIESLFGTIKQQATDEVKDANRIALRIPAICGKLTRNDAIHVLDISVKEQEEIVGPMLSLIKQRRRILPNPNNLDEIVISDKKPNLVLLPRTEKWLKSLK